MTIPNQHQATSLNVLRTMVRNAEEPDNPHLLGKWLSTENERVRKADPTTRRQSHIHQFQLMLDVVADELLPSQWRCLCLDNIHRPLCALRRATEGADADSLIRELLHELAVTCSYTGHSLRQ